MQTPFGFIAFISYKREDEKWARWIQRKLEFYHVPLAIRKKYKNFAKGIRPVFRDKTDLNTGVLTDEIKKALDKSKFLILICSPKSISSRWVNEEVEYFIRLGRYENIIPVIIVEGNFGDNTADCIPTALRKHWETNPELLCVDVKELGRAKTIVQIAARIFGVDFSSLWSRYAAHRRRQFYSWIGSSILTLLCLYILVIPLTLRVKILTENADLPYDGLVLKTDNGEFPITARDTAISLSLPGYRRFQETRLKIEGNYFIPIEKGIRFNMKNAREIEIRMLRDSTFGLFKGTVINPDRQPLEGAEVKIGEIGSLTDRNGEFQILIPSRLQSETKPVIVAAPGYRPFRRVDESPGKELIYILSEE